MVLVFPNFNLWPLAFVALVPLLAAIEGKTPRQALRLGLGMGLVYFGGSLSWIEFTLVRYGDMNLALALLALFLLALYLALYPAVVAWLLARTSGSPWPVAIRLPIFWVALEGLRGVLLTGFPWNDLGHSMHQARYFLQMADLAGVPGLSFYLATFNGLIYESLIRPKERSRSLLAMGALLAFGLGYGAWRLAEPLPEKTFRIALVQHNAAQDHKWDAEFRQEIVQVLLELTQRVLAQKPDLIVWPEAATPFRFRQNPVYRKLIGDFVASAGIPLFFGSPDKDPQLDRYYNAAFLLDKTGDIQGQYRKMQLVPFGEYVPLESILFFIEKLAAVGGSFYPGDSYTVFDLGRAKFGAFICFESAFGEIVYPFARRGAQFFVTITNDSWFGDTSGTSQHEAFLPFRAVECRRPIAQAAQSGFSAVYDQRGERVGRTRLLVRDTLVADVHPAEESRWTLYMLLGNWVAYLSWILAVLVAYKRRLSP